MAKLAGMEKMAMMAKEKSEFNICSEWVKQNIPTLQPKDLSLFYGLMQQVTETGEFKFAKNPKFSCDWHEKAKYKAWKAVSNLSQRDAMLQG